MPVDLPVKDLKIVRHILAGHLPDCEIRAFGSRVTGKAKPFSDLDLVVMTTVPVEKVADLKTAFEESDLPVRVDIACWPDLPPSLQEEIRRTGVIVQPAA
jgi:predicted nucleotidyltransferase